MGAAILHRTCDVAHRHLTKLFTAYPVHVFDSSCPLFSVLFQNNVKMGGEDARTAMQEALEETVQRLGSFLSSLQKRFKLEKKMKQGTEFAKEHPLMTLFILVSLVMCSVPMTCFVVFALGSLFLTFTGFVFVEGFLLTVGGILLGGALCVMAFLSLGFSALLALGWLTYTSGVQLVARARDRVQRASEPPSGIPLEPHNLEIPKDAAREKGD